MKKVLSLLLSLTMAAGLLVSCGGKDEASSSEPAAAPASSSEPEEPPYNPNPLTGLENDGSYTEGERLTAIMINNIANNGANNARPQWGISNADILVEIKVEGGITRFMGLFSDYKSLPQVGPVRSARDQFFQLILPWEMLYVHIGESTVQSEYKTIWEYEDRDLNLDTTNFPRDQARLATGVNVEHAAYTNGEILSELVEERDYNMDRTYNSCFFDFVNYNEPNRVLNGDDAVKIDIVHSTNYRTYFDYDASTNRYMMSQYSAYTGSINPTVDANNDEQLGFENVIVLFTDIHRHPNYVNDSYDIQQVEYGDGGVGYYFNGGKAEYIRWMKGSPNQALRIVDSEGNEQSVKINPGKTYLGIVSTGDDTAGQFGYYSSESASSTSVPEADSTATDYVDTDQ